MGDAKLIQSLAYPILVLITQVFNIRNLRANRLLNVTVLGILFCYIIIKRADGVHFDLHVYADLMEVQDWSNYYYREFIFHSLLRFFFTITSSSHVTFIAIDILTVVILCKICSKNKVSYIYVLIIFSSFSFMIGFENIYRQNLGTILLCLSLAYLHNKQYTLSLLLYIIALFTHNMVLFFLPVYLSSYFNRYKAFTIFGIIFAILLLAARHFELARDVHSEGRNVAFLYLSYIFLQTLLLNILSFKNNGINWQSICIFCTALIAYFYMSYNGSERLMISCATLLLFNFINSTSKMPHPNIIRSSILFTYAGPLYMSGVSTAVFGV